MVSEPQRMQWFGVLVCTTNMQEMIFFLVLLQIAKLSVRILMVYQLQKRDFCSACLLKWCGDARRKCPFSSSNETSFEETLRLLLLPLGLHKGFFWN